MDRYSLKNSDIKDYLDTSKEFSKIKEFCDFLRNNEADSNIKVGIKKMLSEKVLINNKTEKEAIKKKMFVENIEWIQNNCCIEDEQVDMSLNEVVDNDVIEEEKAEYKEVVPQSDFQIIKQKYEHEDFEKVTQLEDEDIDYSEGIVLHEKSVITKQNNVQLFLSKKKSNISFDFSKVLIVEAEGNKVLALGYMVPSVKNELEYTLVFEDKQCIDYDLFKGISKARFVLYSMDGKIYSRTFEMEYKPFYEEKERPLCIDFGTSNTSAGSYGIKDRRKDEPEIVKFIDVTVNPNNTEAVLLPTIVYVDDCSDPNNIKYLFGYEARKKIETEHYESKASVYYEIKRWISSAEDEEEIRDKNNNKAKPKKKDIIKAYLDYVIESSEQYFGTKFTQIHFSAPVKLKEKFISELSKLYKGEKEILSVDDSIDEGVAIVYNQIIKLMYSDNAKEGTKKSIMIMDCGGGTTDLASCEYQFQNTNAGVELYLDTCFENGNSNFGGNNITYRIMQLLKIKIAAKLSTNLIDNMGEAIQLIDKSENEILGLIEASLNQKRYDSDKANDEVYAKFLENYARAERIVPTRYVDNEVYRGTESLKKIKRNFFYLWRQAEQIKIEFYKTERVLMDFDDTDEDAIIDIKSKDNYYLYVNKGDELVKEQNPFDKISITIKEINRVICGDIYSLLVGLFKNGELTSRKVNVDEFDYYKLSGQSCKISLFSELIKEYIPGRKFRPAIAQNGDNKKRSSEDLKLDCVKGCINYVKDKNRPEMNIISKPGLPEIIYSVLLKGNHNEDKKLFDCDLPQKILMEISHKNTREYPLVVVGKDNVPERDFIFKLRYPGEDGENDVEWSISDIKKKIRSTCSDIVTEDDIDLFVKELRKAVSDRKETINSVFAVPAKDGYGIYLGQVQVSSSADGVSYMLLRYEYENFEDSSKTFFDGRR